MKTYKVLGTAPVFGKKPGETFQTDLPAEQEKRMVERGSIEVVGSSQTAATPPVSGGGVKPPEKPGK